MKLNKYQYKEFSKYWFDLSKLTFASLIVKLFEPGAPKFEFRSILTIISGVMFSIVFITLGLKFSKEVKTI